MITGVQIRSARAAVGWSIEQLAQKSGVSGRTIKRYEAFDGTPCRVGRRRLVDIKSALEAGGIEFTGTPEDGPEFGCEPVVARNSDYHRVLGTTKFKARSGQGECGDRRAANETARHLDGDEGVHAPRGTCLPDRH